MAVVFVNRPGTVCDLCGLGTLCCLLEKSPGIEVTPLRVTAGHHASGARRAETVIVVWFVPWSYSGNYGYYGLRQWRNVPRGLHYSRPQNNAKNEISMSYGNIHGDYPMRVESPRESCYRRESRIRLATTHAVLYGLHFWKYSHIIDGNGGTRRSRLTKTRIVKT